MEAIEFDLFKGTLMARTDDLTAWRSFVTFAKSGTLTAAAQALDIEISSLSRAIAGLEKSLGCELIRHNTRPLQLTEAGKVALKRMESILRAHDNLLETLYNDHKAFSGRIRLSSAPGFATRRLMPIIRPFIELHPNIAIDIQTGNSVTDVAKGLCDLAVITGEPTLPDLVYMSRGRNVYLPVASPDYVSRNGLPVTPEHLREHRGYIYSGPVREETKVLYRGEKTAAIEFGTAVRSTDVLAIREAVLAGMGVAVDMPLVQIHEDLVEGRLVPILPGWSRPPVECYIVTNRDAWHLRRVRVFFEWFANAMRETFGGYERSVSSVVGLPVDHPVGSRTEIHFTDTKKRNNK